MRVSLRGGFFHAVGWGGTVRGRAGAETDAEAEPGPEGRKRKGGRYGEAGAGARLPQVRDRCSDREAGFKQSPRGKIRNTEPENRFGRSQIRTAIRSEPQIRA